VLNRILNEARELWQYRSLLRMLVTRDLKTRYRGSVLGVMWSFLQPLGLMVVMTLAFTYVTRVTANMPKAHMFILSGTLAWNMFTAAVVGGTGSVMANSALVKKVYFPRILLPISVGVSSFINYLLSLPVFVLMALLTGFDLHSTLLIVPFVALIQLVFCIGVAMLLGTLNVFYRDTAFIVDLSMLALFFVTPVFYDLNTTAPATISVLGTSLDPARLIYYLNPMASFVNIFQDAMYKGVLTVPEFWIRTILTACAVFVLGYVVFRKFSPRFAESI
jgi:lipopolysaccharide transport system permease protein